MDGSDAATYLQALADVRALRSCGTYRVRDEKTPPVARPQCGTERGYQLHGRFGEKPCGPCREKAMESQRRRRSTGSARADL